MNFSHFTILYFLIFIFILEIKCCDLGWQAFKNKCFKYIQTKVNYKNAVVLCNSYNATLVSIHSREEHVFIEDMARHYSTSSGVHWVWLGGERIKNNKTNSFTLDFNNITTYENQAPKFSWQDGSPFNYSGWRYNCPDKRRDEDCILMSIFQSRPSHWCNYKCDTNQDHVICQKIMPIETTEQKANRSNEINETQTELSTGENSCDIGWTLNENYCYKFFETNQTWSYANTMCLKNNAYLLTVNSESEQMFVQNYLFTISGALEAVWLGAKRKGFLKELNWIDNSTFNYQNYAPHEPDNRDGKEDCLAMNNVEEYFGLWLDAPCSVRFSVCCKKKAKLVPGCLNSELLNEAQKAIQMNDFIIQLLQRITNRLDEVKQPIKVNDKETSNNAIALEIKSEVDSILNNSSLIRLSLHLSIFISMILICLIMCLIIFVFKRKNLHKKPYRSIFSFKNLNYEEKNLNSNEYEELLYGQNVSPTNQPTNTRQLSDKV